jgi:hypothetical protein
VGWCRAGKGDDAFKPDIQLNGEGIEPAHCVFDNENDTVYITPTTATAHVFINGMPTPFSLFLVACTIELPEIFLQPC